MVSGEIPRLDTTGRMLAVPVRAMRSGIGQHISLTPRSNIGRSSTLPFQPELPNIQEESPMLYGIPNPHLEINEVYGIVRELREFHAAQGDNFLVRMSVPPSVYETMDRIGINLRQGGTFDITGYLEWLDSGRSDVWRGGVVTGNASELKAFYPEDFMPNGGMQPQIIINLCGPDQRLARSTLKLSSDLAYYSAKAGILSDPDFSDSARVELLAKLFALSVQHRFLNALRLDKQGVLVEKAPSDDADESRIDHLQGYDVMFCMGEIFRGIHRSYADIFRLMGQYSDIRDEVLSAFRISGTFESLSINSPIVVDPNK